MDATLTIRIRAEAHRAQQQINKTAEELSKLERMAFALNRQRGGFFDSLSGSNLVKAGKNLQWLGRQLLYNFTLPLGLAGVTMFKTFLEFEKGMTQLRKVYGDIEEDQAELRKETDALGTSFRLLSTYFGVHVAEVANIGAAWAAAGSAGRGLAENVKTTLEAMILGDMEAERATEALIAIQATWRLSTIAAEGEVSELTKAMAQLNIIENQTGIGFEGLVKVYERAGGAARTAGLKFEELGALAAALVPATGNATRAGNALRTIMSRLASPTEDMTDALRLMGIEVTDPDWMGASVLDKLRLVADEFFNLSSANQNLVSSILGSRWQVNRLSVLLADLNTETGYFNKALEAASNETATLETYQRELLEVLGSHPRRWEIMKNAIRNAMMDALIPLIPTIFSIMKMITNLAVAFSNLPENTQKLILIGFAAIALVGPLLVVIASFMELAGILKFVVFRSLFRVTWIFWNLGKLFAWVFGKEQLKAVWKFAVGFKDAMDTMILAVRQIIWMLSAGFMVAMKAIGAGFVSLAATLGLPVWALVAIIAAVVAAIIILLNDDLRNGVWDGIKWVAEGLYKLPGVFVDVFNAIIRFLSNAVMQVWDFLSYLNPFAKHSPSLVDNVKAGVATILDEYAKLNKIGNLVSGAVTALESFGVANAGVVASRRESELRERANVSGVQGGDALVDAILALENELPSLTREINAQSLVVAKLTFAYDQAAAEVEQLERQLESTESQLASVTATIDAAYDRIAELANTPIKGMMALEDEIFANELAANKLKMELLEFERAGISIDSIRDKYAALQGDIEMLQAEQTSLRMAGAGSEILRTYDDQIQAIRDQQGEMSEVESTIQEIQEQLDALDLERRFLELTKAINFDPLERQIERLATGVMELPFEEIVRQIQEQKDIIAQMEPIQERLAAQVEREAAAVDKAREARDGAKQALDAEKEKLDGLEGAYRDIQGLIREMEQSLTRVSDIKLSQQAEEAQGFLDRMFEAGLGQDFETFGGDDILDREGTLADIEAFNEEMEAMLADALKGLGDGDLFAPLKQKWESFKNWWRDNWKLLFEKPKEWFLIGMSKLWNAIQSTASTLWGYINDWIITPVKNFFLGLWEDITYAFRVAFDGIVAFFTPFWEALKIVWETVGQPIFDALMEVVDGVVIAWGIAWDSMKVAVETVWNIISTAIGTAWGVIWAIFEEIWEALDGYLIPIFELFQVTTLIVWELITLAFQAAWDLIKWIFDKIVEYLGWVGDKFQDLQTVVETVWGIIEGALSSGWNWVRDNVFSPIITFLETTIPVAFGTMRDLVKGVWEELAGIIEGVWNSTIKPIFEGFRAVFQNYVAPAFKWLYNNVIKPAMKAVMAIIGTAWNGVATAIETGVNFFISAFNLLASAVNKVAGLLGIDQRVSSMDKLGLPRFSSGYDFGQADAFFKDIGYSGPPGGGPGMPGYARGGVVRGAQMAMLGEGSNIHPEYIIPTDPRHRNRAMDLWQQAGTRLSRMDGFGILGDIASGAYNIGKKGIKAAGGIARKGAVELIWDPIKWSVEKIISQIPVKMFKQASQGMLDIVNDWMRGSSTALDEYAESLMAVPNDGAGSWRVIPEMLNRAGIPHKILSTYRPGAVTRFTGRPSWHGLDRAIDLSGPTGMRNYNANDLLAINLAIYDVFKPYLKELIYGGPGAKNVFRGRDHSFSNNLMREHVNHVHAALARGGFVVPRTPGGSLFRIGEGLYNEKVQVIPLNGQGGGEGDRHFHFYGDLSFPSITNDQDAEEFLRNLEALSGGQR